MRIITAFLLFCFCFSSAQATDILLLISQRNAETVAAAVDQFNSHPAHSTISIQARSVEQLLEMESAQQQQLLNSAKLIVGAGLFGPVVAQLDVLLNKQSPSFLQNQSQQRFIFSSDHRLTAHSQFNGKPIFTSDKVLRTLSDQQADDDIKPWLQQLLAQYPQQAAWLQARAYWQAGGSDNINGLLTWAAASLGHPLTAAELKPVAQLRWMSGSTITDHLPTLSSKPVVVILDHAAADNPGDRNLLEAICQKIESQDAQCITALSYWGEAGIDAVKALQPHQDKLSSIIMLQDFVIGGGEARQPVTDELIKLNVPLIKAIKSRDASALQRQFLMSGIPLEKIYYQVAMPELQGASQPQVIASAGEIQLHAASGLRIRPIVADNNAINTLAKRSQRWLTLQQRDNADKKLAIVYYNHPPGRHNIGADNLDVPATLWTMLKQLQAAGYNTGTLPESQQALLDIMQERGVNLPNDAGELAKMADSINTVDKQSYQQYFASLPLSIQREMRDGPFGYLHEQLRTAVDANELASAQQALDHNVEEFRHLLEGVDHPARPRALSLLTDLQQCYQQIINEKNTVDGKHSSNQQPCWNQALTIIDALRQTGIEGLGGWGEAPGRVMTHNGNMLLPGIRFGNIFIGPQPPRGWEINEELLHANLAFPPPHQYLGFYHFLRDTFKADAIVHVGRHSTYEFLPRRSVGLMEDDYSRIIADDIPGIYPYIVDGVGEGIQAKRRGLAVMIDHLTPPLQHTPLYDDLLQLRQLIESFEANHNSDNVALSSRLMQQIRAKIDSLELKDELAQSMSAELAIMGISFDEVDDDMLVHEIGHYLTTLQERFMPLGLHVFGKDWTPAAIDMMLKSMAPENNQQKTNWQQSLQQSPAAEMTGLLNGLNGGFIAPGKGNDPIRSPDSLPTGRNFYALDSSLIPSATAWQLGSEMAQDARANNSQTADKSEALILWASDVVRDEGVMIAFGFDMLGVEPEWNSRGLLKGLKTLTLDNQRVRRNMVFTTSGLFRDLYGQQLILLDQAVLMAIAAAGNTIISEYPALNLALKSALTPLENVTLGNESLTQNQVAAHWVKQARQLLSQGINHEQAGKLAGLRVFGDAPGSYGAGINRMVERSGAWEKREELAAVYMRRLGHAYSSDGFGTPAQQVFSSALRDVENTYFGRSSNLYGLIDNNDAFDYLGGLSLAVETLSGTAPNSFVINHADSKGVITQPLSVALRQELRGRFLNPEWLQGLMQHGYAGARTMGSEFLEYLWGWQVTNPTLVGDWAWEEVKAVYMDDRYNLELDKFLADGHNAHVKANMLAIMLVAIHKEFWQADQQTTEQLAQEFAQLVIANGLPGSGHTTPDHPMMQWLENFVTPQQWQQLQHIINSAQQQEPQPTELHTVTEIQAETTAQQTPAEKTQADPAEQNTRWQWYGAALSLLLLIIFIAGFMRVWRHAAKTANNT